MIPRYDIIIKYYSVIVICCFVFLGCQGEYPARGIASWYRPHRTATGETYHKGQLTCAMRRRDFGKEYLVCNLENNKCVVARHNDFGPAFYLFALGRIIDLSKYAFSKIADVNKGTIRVRIGEVNSGTLE